VTATLVLLRHGASEWSEGARFTGSVDVPLSANGGEQAGRAGRLLREAGQVPDVVFTSTLRRAVDSAHAVIEAAGASAAELYSDARLDERRYGVWQGRDKREVAAEVGDETYLRWRRSFDAAPPGGETLREVLHRVRACWSDRIAPRLVPDAVVLIVSHSNVLRALIKDLDGLDDRQIVDVNVPTGIPLLYGVKGERAVRQGYLDPERARLAETAVALEGTGSAR
jgi:2,3-bisphosphoglycerate-dependent phosphoglycerate mutase